MLNKDLFTYKIGSKVIFTINEVDYEVVYTSPSGFSFIMPYQGWDAFRPYTGEQ